MPAAAPLDSRDLAAIQQLYARQAHAIDGGDARGWAATFTPDGVFRSPTYPQPSAGAEELTAFAAAFARSASEAGVVRRHWTTNLVVEPDGTHQATARLYALVLATPRGEAPRIERSVLFRDRLVRRGERWLLAERTVEVDGA
jgi:uncharacterized protein (TIGR02246 family)